MSSDPVRVLLIEDDPTDTEAVQRALHSLGDFGEFGEGATLEHVETLAEGLDRLAKAETDVLLLDLHLPDSAGVDTVVRVREQASDVPVVVFTTAGDEETALGALRAGAQDYLPKPALDGSTLRRSLRYAIERRELERTQRTLEEQLLEARRRESLATFALGSAHGFNALIGTILDHADDGLGDGPGWAKRHFVAIRGAALRAAKLTQQLRDYAAAEQPEAHDVDLSAFVLEVSEMLEPLVPSRVHVDYDLSARVPHVKANELQLRQVLIQLVVNAVEALGDEEGRVSVRTGSTWADQKLISQAGGDVDLREGMYGFVEVRDDGEVIDPALRARIFDPFFTTRLAGRGLGLGAVLGIVRQHHGAVCVRSAPEDGTVFTLLFPQQAPRTRSVPSGGGGSAKKVG